MTAKVVLPCIDGCEVCGGGNCEEEFEIPIIFVVCSTCEGRGKHVNPDIDSHGITADEWDRDWDYEDRESYVSGFYDVLCYECGGKRVVPEINENMAEDDVYQRYIDYTEYIVNEAYERMRERRYGY